MANKITFEEFKNILDYIEQRQPDNYSSLYLYVNEYTKNAKVFKHRVDEEEVRTIADAVVIQQSLQLVDSEHRYELPVIRDSLWATSQGKEPKDPVKVYDSMLSGYANAEKVMYTICRAYGVILDENFKYMDTVAYNNLLRIIASFYTNLEDVSVQPFGAKKYSSTEYLSYYPVYIVYQVGKYLSDLGLFESDVVLTQPNFKYDYEYINDELKLCSKSELKNICNILLDNWDSSDLDFHDNLSNMCTYLIELLDTENQLTNFIHVYHNYSNNSLDVVVIPKINIIFLDTFANSKITMGNVSSRKK